MFGSNRKQRLQSEKNDIGMGAFLICLGTILVCGLIAAVITLGVFYANASQWPKNTTTIENLIFPVTKRVTIPKEITQDIGLETANINVTNVLVETSSAYHITRILNIGGIITSNSKKRGGVTTFDVGFYIISYFPADHPAVAHVGSCFKLTVSPSNNLVCTVQPNGLDIRCNVSILSGELVSPGGTFTTAGSFSYVVNK